MGRGQQCGRSPRVSSLERPQPLTEGGSPRAGRRGPPGATCQGQGCTCWGGSPVHRVAPPSTSEAPRAPVPWPCLGRQALPPLSTRCRAPASRRPPARDVPAGGRARRAPEGAGGSCAAAPKPERRAGGLRGGGGRGGDPASSPLPASPSCFLGSLRVRREVSADPERRVQGSVLGGGQRWGARPSASVQGPGSASGRRALGSGSGSA